MEEGVLWHALKMSGFSPLSSLFPGKTQLIFPRGNTRNKTFQIHFNILNNHYIWKKKKTSSTIFMLKDQNKMLFDENCDGSRHVVLSKDKDACATFLQRNKFLFGFASCLPVCFFFCFFAVADTLL